MKLQDIVRLVAGTGVIPGICYSNERSYEFYSIFNQNSRYAAPFQPQDD